MYIQSLLSSYLGVEGDASADVDHHLEMGKRLLAAGQLTEALSHYHSAVGKPVHSFPCILKNIWVLFIDIHICHSILFC